MVLWQRVVSEVRERLVGRSEVQKRPTLNTESIYVEVAVREIGPEEGGRDEGRKFPRPRLARFSAKLTN